MVSELNFPSCRCQLPHAAFSPASSASTSDSISQLWQLQNCYKFHTFPHASQRCVPATLTERHTVPTPPSSNLVPSQSLSLLCLSSAFSSTVSAVSDLLQNYINCNSLFLAFCFLLSSPSSLSLFAMLSLSALCLVKLLVSLLWEARGKSRVGGGSLQAVKLLLALQSRGA